MRVTGIITEYNPFHNGHRYHIEQTRKLTNCDVLICVMSPNFVQRGEPAICDKWTRAKTAIMNGCDIVLELPFPFATQSAKQFAQGGVKTLELAGVNNIVFGSEINDIETLKKICAIDESQYLDLMKEGLSPVKAYETIYGTMNANDILGINYIKAMQGTSILPLSIKRTTDYHDDNIQGSIASATAIRKAFYEQHDVESATCMANELQSIHQLKNYYPLIQNLLLTQDSSYLSNLFLMDEGIENQLRKQAQKYHNFEDFLAACISKRYTASKIRRTLIHLINQTTKEDMNTLPELSHIRVLAFNNIGKSYLKQLKEQDVMIASRFNQIPLPYRKMELKATQVYSYPLQADDKQRMMESELQSSIYLP